MADKVMFMRSVDIVPMRKGIYKDIMKDTTGFRLLVKTEEEEPKCEEPDRLTCKGCKRRKSCKLVDKATCTQPDREDCDGCPDEKDCKVGKSLAKAQKPRRQRHWGDDEEYDRVMRNFGMTPGKPGEEIEQQLVFGWANVTVQEDGTTPFDHDGDTIDTEVLESAAYNYVLQHGLANQEHEWGTECGWLVESMMFTKDKMAALGIPEGTVPEGWFVGFYIPDPDVYKKVKNGEYNMFSIEGYARRVPLDGSGDWSRDVDI